MGGNKQIRPVDWKEYDALSTVHLNSQVDQYDGFMPGRRVSGRSPENAIGAVDNPLGGDFTNTSKSPFAHTRRDLSKGGGS